MRCNVGGADRAVRIIVGVALIVTAILAFSGTSALLGYLVGAILLFTGVVRFCPVSTLFGRDTAKETPAGKR